MKERKRQHRVYLAVKRALAGVTLTPADYTRIRRWINEELPQFLASGTDTSLVFGSYRRGYHRSLRIVQHELNKEANAIAVLLGDTPSLDLTIGAEREDPIEFSVRFHLMTEFADRNIAVYEKDSGGESVELGLLRQNHCFSCTVVMPRDYYGVRRDSFDSKEMVFEVARDIALADDLNDEHMRAELQGMIATAQADGLEITEEEVIAVVEDEIADRDESAPSYSWVHLAMFRQFEAVGRCYPWHSERELRDQAREIGRVFSHHWWKYR